MTLANGYKTSGDIVVLQTSGAIAGASNMIAPRGYIVRTSGSSLVLRALARD